MGLKHGARLSYRLPHSVTAFQEFRACVRLFGPDFTLNPAPNPCYTRNAGPFWTYAFSVRLQRALRLSTAVGAFVAASRMDSDSNSQRGNRSPTVDHSGKPALNHASLKCAQAIAPPSLAVW